MSVTDINFPPVPPQHYGNSKITAEWVIAHAMKGYDAGHCSQKDARSAAWSQYVIAMGLKPQMDAKDLYKIFDRQWEVAYSKPSKVEPSPKPKAKAKSSTQWVQVTSVDRVWRVNPKDRNDNSVYFTVNRGGKTHTYISEGSIADYIEGFYSNQVYGPVKQRELVSKQLNRLAQKVIDKLAGKAPEPAPSVPPTQAPKRKGKKAAKPKVNDKVKLLGKWGHIIEVRVDDVRIKPDGVGDAAVLIYIDMLHKVPYKPDPIAKMSFYWQVKPRTAAPPMPPILTAPPELTGGVLGGGVGLPPTQAAPKRKKQPKKAGQTTKRGITLIEQRTQGEDSYYGAETKTGKTHKNLTLAQAQKVIRNKSNPYIEYDIYVGGKRVMLWSEEGRPFRVGYPHEKKPTATPKETEPTQRELLARAEELGREGFFAGKQAPAQDAKLLDMCSNRRHSQMMALMTAWSKGWHAEHRVKTDEELRKKGIITPRMEAAAKHRQPQPKPTPTPSVPPILAAPPELAADVLGGGATEGMRSALTTAITEGFTGKPKRTTTSRKEAEFAKTAAAWGRGEHTPAAPKRKQKPAASTPPILAAPPELAADVLGGGVGLPPTQAAKPKRKPKTPKAKKTTAAKTKKATKTTAAKPKTKKTAATTKLTPSQREYLAINGFVMVKRGGKYVKITNSV